jgi:Flp pilus assembly protein TadG
MMLAAMGKWFRLTKRLGTSRQGHAAIMFSILAFPLILAIGYALDFAQASKYRTELQNVADAVALAAVRGLPVSVVNGQAEGRGLYEGLMTSVRIGLLTDNLKITLTEKPDYKAFVEITATAKGNFGNTINLGVITFEVNAEAILPRQGTEIALVLDLSGSMTTNRMKALGASLTTFQGVISASPAADNKLRIAAIPFAQSVTLPVFAAQWLSSTTERNYATAAGRTCFAQQGRALDTSLATPGSRSFTLSPDYAKFCMTETSFALASDYSQLETMATAFKNPPAWRVNAMNPLGTPYWGTNLYTGAAWAARLLDPAWASHLPVESAPDSPNRANKFAVLMTDGDQLEIYGVTRAQADINLLSVCDQMRAQGIEIFTIGFAVTAQSEALLKNCSGRDSNFVKATNEDSLNAAFEQIGKNIGEPRPRLLY